MAIFNLFSKRAKRARGEMPDVYQYEKLPENLRIQIIHIWRDTLVVSDRYDPTEKTENHFRQIVEVLCREYGVFRLTGQPANSKEKELCYWFLEEREVERCLDAIELSLLLMKSSPYVNGADDAISELNERMKEAGVGFRCESDQVIRIDSEVIHSEVVKPALALLHQPEFEGANEEFMKAHKAYRKGDQKQCIQECGKAFESALKAICEARGWPYNAGKDQAKKLIEIVLNEGLVPNLLQDQLTRLQGLLVSGTPSLRNKKGSHGQGAKLNAVPDYLAAYQLHQTAAAILLVVEAHQAKG